LPAHVGLRAKVGVDHPVVAAWDDIDSRITASVNIPQAGWYRLKLRYCTGDLPMRSILIDGKYPFSQAHNFSLPGTIGEAPSDGWSNRKSDWRDAILGEPETSGGWLFYFPKGDASIALENDGGGLNLDSLDLQPASAP
jgi:hypothetical protein